MAGLEGKTLGHYELRKLTGSGGMADVYLGYDTHAQHDVAIKVFKRDDEEMLRRFIREARLMARLDHHHLMSIYDTGESAPDGVTLYYIVMPFMQGGNLRARIRRTPLSLKQTCDYLTDIASALDYMHEQGIIHRDIKSSNVLLDAEGEGYLADFGIARTTSDTTQLTSTGSILGTVEYVAPELFETGGKATALSDLYSLGVLLFEMVTGRVPFSSENQIALVAMHVNKLPPSPRSIVPSLSLQVERVILKGLEKKPELRYKKATDFANAFCQAIEESSSEQTVRLSGAAPSLDTVKEANKPLVLAPPPAVTPAPGSLTRSAANYPVFPETPETPLPYRPMSDLPRTTRVRRRLSPARIQSLLVAAIALIILLAVAIPVLVAVMQVPNDISASIAKGTAEASTAAAAQTGTVAAVQQTQNALATVTQHSQNTTATTVASTAIAGQAQAAATAGVIQTATAGDPSYIDALTLGSAGNGNWDQKKGNCEFLADGYHVSAILQVGCRDTARTFSNFAVTVDMKITNGEGGIFFRVSANSLTGTFSGYLFQIDNQGNYKILRSNDFTIPLDADSLGQGTVQTGWKTGGDNLLQIRAAGSDLSFYVNGVFLIDVQSGTFSSGNIALMAKNGSSIYTNLKVYTLF